jgi:hypothetical protein
MLCDKNEKFLNIVLVYFIRTVQREFSSVFWTASGFKIYQSVWKSCIGLSIYVKKRN